MSVELRVKERTPQSVEYEKIAFYDIEGKNGRLYHGIISGSSLPIEGDSVELRISRLGGMLHETCSGAQGSSWYGFVKDYRVLKS